MPLPHLDRWPWLALDSMHVCADCLGMCGSCLSAHRGVFGTKGECGTTTEGAWRG